MLFVVLGLNVNIHICRENHHLMTSFGDASMLCEHCLGHHHDHMQVHEFEDHLSVRHFGAKCCCEDYESDIRITDYFTFSTEKDLIVFFPSVLFAESFHLVFDKPLAQVFHCLTHEKIPYLLTGRLKTIFFSNLKLDPTV